MVQFSPRALLVGRSATPVDTARGSVAESATTSMAHAHGASRRVPQRSDVEETESATTSMAHALGPSRRVPPRCSASKGSAAIDPLALCLAPARAQRRGSRRNPSPRHPSTLSRSASLPSHATSRLAPTPLPASAIDPLALCLAALARNVEARADRHASPRLPTNVRLVAHPTAHFSRTARGLGLRSRREHRR